MLHRVTHRPTWDTACLNERVKSKLKGGKDMAVKWMATAQCSHMSQVLWFSYMFERKDHASS